MSSIRKLNSPNSASQDRRKRHTRRWALLEYDTEGEVLCLRPYGYMNGDCLCLCDDDECDGDCGYDGECYDRDRDGVEVGDIDRKSLRKFIRRHRRPIIPICIQTDAESGEEKRRELPGFVQPLAPHEVEPCLVPPNTTKWAAVSYSPKDPCDYDVRTFAGFGDAAEWFGELRKDPMQQAGRVVLLLPPGDHFYCEMPAWPGRWVVGIVRERNNVRNVDAVAVYCRRKDAFAHVRQIIKTGSRPVIGAPFTAAR